VKKELDPISHEIEKLKRQKTLSEWLRGQTPLTEKEQTEMSKFEPIPFPKSDIEEIIEHEGFFDEQEIVKGKVRAEQLQHEMLKLSRKGELLKYLSGENFGLADVNAEVTTLLTPLNKEVDRMKRQSSLTEWVFTGKETPELRKFFKQQKLK
jgi:hypothetical protein